MGDWWREESFDGVGHLALGRPPRNELSFPVMAELYERLTRMAADSEIRVVVLSSDVAGYFAAHADLADLERLAKGPVREAVAWYSALSALGQIPQPVVAAIDGAAGGGGLELALACTLRWASARARFRMPETSLGIVPGAGGTQRLPAVVGRAAAAELVLCGTEIDAETAQQLSLVGRVLPAEGFEDSVLAAARELAGRPGQALAASKRLLADRDPSLGARLRAEGTAFAELLGTPESARLRAAQRREYERADGDLATSSRAATP